MVRRGDDDRRLQGHRVARRDPVADVRHRPEIPGQRPLLVRRRDDRHLHARAVGMQRGQLADARRHADGVGDRVRVDVGIARVRRVGHRGTPGLPSEVARPDARTAPSAARTCAGRGRVDERREPDPGKRRSPRRKTAAGSTASCSGWPRRSPWRWRRSRRDSAPRSSIRGRGTRDPSGHAVTAPTAASTSTSPSVHVRPPDDD